MITGLHAIVFSPEAEKVRAFLADVVGMPSVDAGGGWLIFALPPAELAVHPADGAGHHELYLMCDNIQATLAELRSKGAEVARDVSDQGWGCSPPSVCRTARNSPSTSPSIHRPFALGHAQAFHWLTGDLGDEVEVLIDVQYGQPGEFSRRGDDQIR